MLKVLCILALLSLECLVAPSTRIQDPLPCPLGPTCECKATAGDVSANPFEKCPCQRLTYCWLGITVPSGCCTLDPNDQETPCVIIDVEKPSLHHGCCYIDPDCEIPISCAVIVNITVTVSECCSATSLAGGVGTTGTIDCSGIKCCVDDKFTVSSGSSSNDLSGLGDSTNFQAAIYMACGESNGGPLVVGKVACGAGGGDGGH